MKFTFKHTMVVGLLTAILGFSACEKTELTAFDRSFAGIYFQEDSLYFSFGVTPLDVNTYNWEVPIRVMGEPATHERTVSVRVDPARTTAVEGVHYHVVSQTVVHPDSVNAFIPVQILRDNLGTDDYKLTFVLEESSEFLPVNNPLTSVSLHFNNRVERPNWRDFRGNLTWPSQLGTWNPMTYIKVIELFREIEHKSPATYRAMVDTFGPDLATVNNGWPWDYNHTMIKYILIPLYQYFVEQNPHLGITIPRPSNY